MSPFRVEPPRYDLLLGMPVHRLETPVVTIDLDIMERNLTRWQAYCDEHGIANRPHIKTHKVVELARRQVEIGARGITCQTLGEAEVMADGGIDDIFLPYNILGEEKLERLRDLARRAKLKVTCDNEPVARGLSRAFAQEADPLTVLVECDTGMGRCGVQTPDEAVELARLIADLPGLRFGGLMTFPTRVPQSDDFMRAAREKLERLGLKPEVVSGGGTPGMWEAHRAQEFSEHRAGTYIFHDRSTVRHRAATMDDCAMRIIATVVSRPTAERAVIDAGSKTLSSDLMGLEGHGVIVGLPHARITQLSEEHGVIEGLSRGELPIGERVAIIPNHACLVSNLHDYLIAIRAGTVEAVWRVAARGLVQ